MGKSLGCLFVHMVFGTKKREPWIAKDLRFGLHSQIIEIIDGLECKTLAVNSLEDHVHILFEISRNLSVAQLAKDLKRLTSRWMKTHGDRLKDFSWQVGYGAFSVSKSQIPKVKRYIAMQESHHRSMNYLVEFQGLLEAHGVEFDEHFLLE